MYRGLMQATHRHVARVVIVLLIATAQRNAAADTEEETEVDSAEASATPESISLAQLVKIAVRQSSVLALAKSDLRQADLNKITAGAPDEWQVTASVNLSTRAEDPIPNSRAQVINSRDLQTALGLAKRVFTGGDFAISLSNNEQSRVYGEAPTVAATANVSVAGIAVRQPLLRGRGGGARINEQRAGLVANVATLAAMDSGGATLRELVTGYWSLAYTRANLEVRIQSQKLAKDQFDLTQKMFQRSAIPDSAVKAAAYGLALREEATLRAQRDLETASVGLRRIAGLEIGPDQIELIPTDELTSDRRTWDLDEVLATAIANNPRLAATRLGVQLAEVSVEVRENGVLPSLDLSLNAGAVGVGTGPGKSISALGSLSSYQVSAGLSFGWEIGGAASAAEKSSRIERATARRSARDAERDLIGAVVLAVHEIEAAQKRVDVGRRAIELAQANLATEQALFRADKSSNVLVFQRQTDLDEARLLAVRAALEYRVSITTVEYLTGEILKRYGVEVVPERERIRTTRSE